MGLYDGAAVAVEQVRKNIKNLPEPIRQSERDALEKGLGISKMRSDGEDVRVTIGFDGYDDHPTKTYPKGTPIVLIARSIESGTSWRTPRKFVAKSKRQSKKAVEKAVTSRIEKQVEEITKQMEE